MSEVIEHNPDVSDLGAIIGCLGERSVKDLEELKAKCSSIDEFLEVARQRADIALVVAAVKAAIGYDYEETEQTIAKKPMEGADGQLVICDVPYKVKKKMKHAKQNDALLKFLLINRLPQFFSDMKKVEINKKSIEIKGDTEKEIREFAGRLLKVIDTEFVEVKNDNNT